MKLLPTLGVLILLLSCTDQPLSRADFLIGTWQREGKAQYEVWEASREGELTGYGYQRKDGQKTITETIAIRWIDQELVFQATVPDQNEGETVSFPLNDSITAYLSFENPAHDFPQKIQYQSLNDEEIEVSVLGEEGKGFSYVQRRQEGESLQ